MLQSPRGKLLSQGKLNTLLLRSLLKLLLRSSLKLIGMTTYGIRSCSTTVILCNTDESIEIHDLDEVEFFYCKALP